MDSTIKRLLIVKLRAALRRGRHRFDPPGCAHCGRDTTDALCAVCEELLGRLEADESVPGMTVGQSATYVSADPGYTRRSDKRGRKPPQLPFEDEC